MVLATHAVTGALIGAVASENLAIAALAGFLSHFILDTIPHWDYSLGSNEKDPQNPLNDTMHVRSVSFFIDLAKIGADFFLGLMLALLMVYAEPTPVVAAGMIGALAAVLPDPLQFIYMKFRPKFMRPLQKFHLFMHATTRLNSRPIIGIGSQLIIIAITFGLYRLVFG
jgi:hypothetical protein